MTGLASLTMKPLSSWEVGRPDLLSLDDVMRFKVEQPENQTYETRKPFMKSMIKHEETMAREIAERKLMVSMNPFFEWNDNVTSLIVRGLPRSMTQPTFLHLLNQQFAKSFDFVFLPHRKKHGSLVSVGFGFVNFLHPRHAQAFKKVFEGKRLDGESRPLSVDAAALQGYEEHFHYYRTVYNDIHNDPQRWPLFFPHGEPLDESAERALQVASQVEPLEGMTFISL